MTDRWSTDLAGAAHHAREDADRHDYDRPSADELARDEHETRAWLAEQRRDMTLGGE